MLYLSKIATVFVTPLGLCMPAFLAELERASQTPWEQLAFRALPF